MNNQARDLPVRLPPDVVIQIGILSQIKILCKFNETIPAKDIFSCIRKGDVNERLPSISLPFLLSKSIINASIRFVPFDSSGALNQSGQGITDCLVKGLIDMVYYSMFLTEERYTKSVISIPTWFTRLEIYYTGNPVRDLLGPNLLFRPFPKFVWVSVILISLFFVLVTAKYRNSLVLNSVAAGSSAMVCLAYSSNLKAILVGHVTKAPFEDIRGLAQSIDEGKYLLAMRFLDDFRMEMIRNSGPFSVLYPLKNALQKHPPVKLNKTEICDYLLNDNRTVKNKIGLATIDVQFNIEAHCGLQYRFVLSSVSRKHINCKISHV